MPKKYVTISFSVQLESIIHVDKLLQGQLRRECVPHFARCPNCHVDCTHVAMLTRRCGRSLQYMYACVPSVVSEEVVVHRLCQSVRTHHMNQIKGLIEKAWSKPWIDSFRAHTDLELCNCHFKFSWPSEKSRLDLALMCTKCTCTLGVLQHYGYHMM